MSQQTITIQDLNDFKESLLVQIKQIISSNNNLTTSAEKLEYLKTREVMKLLKVSVGTLQNMRNNGTLQYSKVGGTIYYDKSHIQAIIDDNSSLQQIRMFK